MDSNEKKIEVSVIIVNYNSEDMVNECIGSIEKNTKEVTYEIIVVSNSPLKKAINCNKLILNKINGGFGYACNIGVSYARGDYVFFLNPDCLLINDAISIIKKNLIKEKASAGGGNLYDRNHKPAMSYYVIKPGIFYEIDTLLMGVISKYLHANSNMHNHTGKNKIITGFISGANLMVEKKSFYTAGGFDERFFLYYEETDLQKNLKGKIISVAQAKIIHYSGACESNTKRKLLQSKLSRAIYYEKNHTKIYGIFSDFLRKIQIFAKIIYFRKNKDKLDYWMLVKEVEYK
jgi:GT2 family glycosyltransferase